MKNFYEDGEGCALNCLTYKLLLILRQYTYTISLKFFFWLAYPLWSFKAIRICFLVILMWFGCVAMTQAQSPEREGIKPLIVAETLPLGFWQDFYGDITVNSPEQLPIIENIDSKLVIVYFWSPLCKPCIESLRKLDDILSEGVDKLVVIPILTNTSLELAQRYTKKLQLNTPLIMTGGLLNETYLSNYLPVWGGAWFYQGKLLAVPVLSEYTMEKILQVINGGNPTLQSIDPLNTIGTTIIY